MELKKITITKDMIISLVNSDGDAMKMFDNNISTNWFPGWNDIYYPASIIIDLKGSFSIKKIRLFDGEATPQLKILAGIDDVFNTKELLNINLDKYNQWREFNVDVIVKYLIIQLPKTKTFSANEIEFYSDSGVLNDIIESKFKLQDNVNGIFGVNSFHWVDSSLLEPFKYIREYQYWEWMENTKGKYTFEPTRSGAGNFDTHYQKMKDDGFVVVPCINQSPKWFNVNNDASFNKDWKPILPGSDSLSPSSYIDFAKFLFQLSARYGTEIVSDSLLDIDSIPFWTGSPKNTKKTGLNLLQYIEVWNEPDKTWKGAQAYFSPFEFAAMMSACYDGHCGTLGPNVGIKTANPNMKVVMGGLARLSIDYIKAMDLWFKTYRTDKIFASDVINFHHYSNSIDIQQYNNTNSFGISPEEDDICGKMIELKTYINTNYTDKEMWLSEYGYDTNNSSQRVPDNTNTMNNKEVIQASWLTRTMLSLMKSNIDKSFLYMIYDESINDKGLYSMSGVVKDKSLNFDKKIAWDYINNLFKALYNSKLDTYNDDLNGNINYVFKNNDSYNSIYFNRNNNSDIKYYISNSSDITIVKGNEQPVKIISNDLNKYIKMINFNIDEIPLIITSYKK